MSALQRRLFGEPSRAVIMGEMLKQEFALGAARVYVRNDSTAITVTAGNPYRRFY